jgi:class 3 adenylate cyclase
MIGNSQMPENFKNIIDQQIKIFNTIRSITNRTTIPDTTNIPIENPTHWLKISDVICIYVDMINSTLLSATNYDNSTAGAYQLFTNTIIKLFHEMEAKYIDVKGDGVFALYNKDEFYLALASAITVKTFIEEEFTPKIKKLTQLELGAHIGIDMKTVLVKKLGVKRMDSRTDRQNEVWAGKPINMAAKLSSLTNAGELITSERFYSKLNNDLVLKSCGCPENKKVHLWEEIDLTNDHRFDFNKAFILKSIWCKTHGLEFYNNIIKLTKK